VASTDTSSAAGLNTAACVATTNASSFLAGLSVSAASTDLATDDTSAALSVSTATVLAAYASAGNCL